MTLNSVCRNVQISAIRDRSWPFHGMFYPNRYRIPQFESKQDIETLDITSHINDWNVSWSLGEPCATAMIKCDGYSEFQFFNKNDVFLIDLVQPGGKKALISALLLSGNVASLNCDKQITRGFTLSCKEPGKVFQSHEIYYNPFTEGIEALSPYLALTGGQLGLSGQPKNVIEKILNLKLFGYDSQENPTEFLGGFLMNDGRRISDWIDLSTLMDRKQPEASFPDISTKLRNLIKNDPCDFSYWPTNGSSIDGPLWRLMQTYSAQPLYELFTYSDYKNGKPVQKIYHRPLPFWCEYYGWELWDSLPCFEFTQNELSGNASFSWSEDEDASYFFINAQQTLCGADTVALQSLLAEFDHGGLKVIVPIIENAMYERYGFKKLIPGFNAIATDTSAEKNEDAKMNLDILRHAILRLWDYNFLNQYYLSGTVAMPLPMNQPIPRIGMRAINTTTKMEYYIVGVTISGGIGKTTTVSLKLTRGMTRQMHQHFTSTNIRKKILQGTLGNG